MFSRPNPKHPARFSPERKFFFRFFPTKSNTDSGDDPIFFTSSESAGGHHGRAGRGARLTCRHCRARRHAARNGPPLDGSAHGRKVSHASRPTRTLAAAQKFYHPPPPPRGAERRRRSRFISRVRRDRRRPGGRRVEGAKVSKRFFIEQTRPPPSPRPHIRRPPPARAHTHARTLRSHARGPHDGPSVSRGP